MSAVPVTQVLLPYPLFEEDRDEPSVLRIPPDVNTLAGFRRWARSTEIPEKLKLHFVQGGVYVDMSYESIDTHVFVKVGIFLTLIQLMRDEDLGQFYTDGVRLTNKKANISNNPDGVAVLWDTLSAGRVRHVAGKRKDREILGTPDWVLEIVSDSSVAKDKKKLKQAYHAAGIAEYWLVDARGDEIQFQILHWRRSGYATAAIKDGWQHSHVFGHDFQLVRKKARSGDWEYTLKIKR